jgi:ribonuclease HII
VAMRRVLPTQTEERRLWERGFSHVAGIDEVGRGPLAGPVVAAAVVLPSLSDLQHRDLPLIRDSKTLSPAQRQRANLLVQEVALSWAVGEVEAQDIDRMGIATATRLAMRRALDQLPQPPDHLLVDALQLSWNNRPCLAVVHGDGLCTAIAAASVVAKVYRDAHMTTLSERYPEYGFSAHKGYASQIHLQALERFGPTPEHRRSFSPLRQRLPLEFAESRA